MRHIARRGIHYFALFVGSFVFIVLSGHSPVRLPQGFPTQVCAIADGIEERVLEKLGEKVWRVEGQQNGVWVAMDYVDVVVHIFQTELRGFYKLEELWADAPMVKYEYEE